MNNGKKSKITLIIILCFLFYFALSFVNQQKVIQAKQKKYEILMTSLEEAKTRNEELKRDLEIVESDEYIEKVAREKLGMVRRNERIFYGVD